MSRKDTDPESLVSVRIDARTVILVKARNWTPDYAERYRARMTDNRRKADRYEPAEFRNRNDHVNDRKKRGGRR